MEKTNAFVKSIIFSVVLISGIAFTSTSCSQITSEPADRKATEELPAKSVVQTKQYVPLPQDSSIHFDCDEVSVNISPLNKQINVSFKKLYNHAKNSTGSVAFALYFLPEQHKQNATLINRFAFYDLIIEPLQSNYGWAERDIKMNIENSSLQKGTYYLMGAVLYYDNDGVWRYTNSALYDFGAIEWDSQSQNEYIYLWQNKKETKSQTQTKSTAIQIQKTEPVKQVVKTQEQKKVVKEPEYVIGSQDYNWDNKFRHEGLNVKWDYSKKTITFKATELRNVSEHATGSLKLALYMMNSPYEGGTLYGKVAEVMIYQPGLQPAYGWKNVEWTASFLSSAPSEAGEKYPVIAVLEYAKTSEENCEWLLCGNNYRAWKASNYWNPGK